MANMYMRKERQCLRDRRRLEAAARTGVALAFAASALRISRFNNFAVPVASSSPRQPRLRAAFDLGAPRPRSGAVLVSSTTLASGAGGTYPFWVLNWSLLSGTEPWACAAALFVSGVLCSAAGVGGGGIYVSLLMALGGLTARDAVPLSKGIVFFGSMASLVLNTRRAAAGKASEKPALINYGVCRIVVPSSLIGTLFGVLINHTASDRTILFMLAGILSFMAITSTRTTWKQYREETAAAEVVATPQRQEAEGAAAVAAGGVPTEGPLASRKAWEMQDIIGVVAMLLTTIACGTTRFHMGRWGFMAAHPGVARLVDCLTLAAPIALGLFATLYNSYVCVQQECWMPTEVAKLSAMAIFTGCFAGLVGIGGGLIFSPFFLLMGLDPAVAVATSSTCVIFTSCSTTFQYLLTGRIIMSLTVLYGLATFFASYCGTSLVHFLQDRFSGRRSYISGIVAFAVLVSTSLVGSKLLRLGQ